MFSGEDPQNGVHGASGGLSLPGDRIAGSCLGPCLQRFALQKDDGRIGKWLSATDVRHSSRRNWFTVRLRKHALAARVRAAREGPAALDSAASYGAPGAEKAPEPLVGVSVGSLMEVLHKRLVDSDREILEVRKERKTFRTENQRLRDQGERLREQVGKVNQGGGSTCTSLALVHDYVSQAESLGFAPVVGLRFASSLLSNSARAKNRWRWASTDMALFSNTLTRVGLSSYRFLSSDLGCPSVATLQRATSIDARDILFFSSHGVRVIGA